MTPGVDSISKLEFRKVNIISYRYSSLKMPIFKSIFYNIHIKIIPLNDVLHLVFLLAVEEMLPLVELEPEWRPKIFDAIFGFWLLLRYLHVVSWDTHPRHQSLQKNFEKKKIRKEFFLLKNLTFHNLDSVRKRLSVIFFFKACMV